MKTNLSNDFRFLDISYDKFFIHPDEMSPSNRASPNSGPRLYPHVSSSSGNPDLYHQHQHQNQFHIHFQWLVKKALETRGEREAANRAYSLR